MKPYLVFAVLAVLSVDTLAQEVRSVDVPAADPAAKVPQVSYRSAFENFTPYREQALAPWREVNDEVARIGGHVGIFRSDGHSHQGDGTPSKPAPGQRASEGPQEPAGQPPVRGAPKSPVGGHHGH